MADDDERSAGQGKTFHVPAGSSEMDFVPNRRNGEFKVGVVGEQGFAGGGVIAADDPVVAAEAVTNFALGFRKVATDGTG